jgi:hypothetical protein
MYFIIPYGKVFISTYNSNHATNNTNQITGVNAVMNKSKSSPSSSLHLFHLDGAKPQF